MRNVGYQYVGVTQESDLFVWMDPYAADDEPKIHPAFEECVAIDYNIDGRPVVCWKMERKDFHNGMHLTIKKKEKPMVVI